MFFTHHLTSFPPSGTIRPMDSLIELAAKKLNAKYIGSASTGEYTGTHFFLLEKDGLYTVVQYAYGTCEICDWQMALEEDWLYDNPKAMSYTDETYEPIVKDFCDQADFQPKDKLMANFHMIFGVGFSETEAQNKITKLLENNL